MEFVAAYWWLWMLGTVACTGLAIWKWISTMLSMAGDSIEVVSLGINATSTVLDEDKTTKDKGVDLAQQAVNKVKERVTSKISSIAIGLISFGGAWVFGILFILSLILNIIDYSKA